MTADDGVPTILPGTFARLVADPGLGPAVVLDVREPAEAAEWPAPGIPERSVVLPLAALDGTAIADLGRRAAGGAVHVLCARGTRAATATRLLRDGGVDAASVAGGMAAWSRVLTAQVAFRDDAITAIQLRREARGCLGYLLVAGDEAVAVDPTGDWHAYGSEAARRGARIVAVVDTHVHADHVSAARELAQAAGAPLRISTGAVDRGARIPGQVALGDGQAIPLGGASVRALALPGHTSDMMGLVLGGGAALVAGDSLFADGVARPDLEVGAARAPAAARLLHRTLHERVLSLGDECVLLPGHYAGGPRDAPIAPRIGEVRRAVRLLDADEERFAADVLAGMPPRPANHHAIIAANLAGEPVDPGSLEVGTNNCAAG